MFTEERVLTISWDHLDSYLENVIKKFYPELSKHITEVETEREDFYYVSLTIRFNSNKKEVENLVKEFLKSLDFDDNEIEGVIESLIESKEIDILDTFVKIIEKDKNIKLNNPVATEYDVLFFIIEEKEDKNNLI